MNWLPLKVISTLCAVAFIAGCGGAGGAGSDSSDSPPKSVTLESSATSVQSDNSDSVTVTATVLDKNNVVVPGATVQFKTSSGQIIAGSSQTDANGEVSATFKSGSVDLSNRTVTVSASVPDTSAKGSIPIQVEGSTLTLSTSVAAPAAGVVVPITATARAVSTAAANQNLRFSISSTSTGSGSLSATSAKTDVNGIATVNFTGTVAGTVNVLVEWLDGDNNPTASATQSFNVQGSGAAFQVNTPTGSPVNVTLGGSQTVSLTVPSSINGVAVGSVRYATTLGTWEANGAKTLIVNAPAATDTQVFKAGSSAGTATIQIDVFSSADGVGSVLASAKLIFSLSATASAAASIDLQSSVSVLAPSSGGSTSTANLIATVRDASLNAVAGAPVLFELVNPTGSGETIDPVVVTTNASGVATSVFTAGTSTIQTSLIRASVVGNGAVTPDTLNITVGGTVGSVAIGTSTEIAENDSKTAYMYPVTVMVTDSNGNAVSGATVSLSLWGIYYHKGTRAGTSPCVAVYSSTHPNEDVNENLTLDPGEDIDGPFGVPDGSLWPPSSAAGSVPATVVTGADGTATFDWTYLKQYASWVTVRLRAKALVQGSEATTSANLLLTPSKQDVDGCFLPSSPFN